MKAETLILGNFITMDEIKPFAKAVTVLDGRIQYAGGVKQAKALCGENTRILDYGENYIYPGFMDAHIHGLFAGYRSLGQGDVSQILPPDKEKYRRVISEYVADHPEKEYYLIAGWTEDGITVLTSAFLDEICKDKPLILNTGAGHSLLLNKAGIKAFGITAEYAKAQGTDLVHVDENGEPTGYLCETPAIRLINSLPISFEEAKKYILNWQEFAFANGFTGAGDAGVELVTKTAMDAMEALDRERLLKLYTFGYALTADNVEDPKAKAKEIAELAKRCSGSRFRIVGAKVFLDGVIEAHTGWLCEDYLDQPGYHGNERFNDREKLTELISETGKFGLSVHAHSIGDGASRFFLDCVEEGQKRSGNMDQRNALAHLQLISPADIQRMADTNTVAVTAPLWTPRFPGAFEHETGYIGMERMEACYPVRSFFDAGVLTVFHTDYPISPSFSAPQSVYMAVRRKLMTSLEESLGVTGTQRGPEETITREEALSAMTKNVAAMFHQEQNLGSISIGKIANFSVLDKDLLNDELEEIPYAKVVATIVDGEEVYKG